MTLLQIGGLLLAAMVVGAGLVMLILGWLSKLSGGHEDGAGCLAIGLALLGLAALVALRVVMG